MNKNTVILGGGESGAGSAVLAQKQGFGVFLSDSGTLAEQYRHVLAERNIEFEEGGHTMERILSADEIIKSPGIPPSAAVVRAATERGIPIVSEIEFAARYTDALMVCITGSNGKTTTTSLLYDMLVRGGVKAGLGGNIGRSFAMQVAENDYDAYVLELSSFQLDNMYDFRANVALLLNITPDHLDRYDYKMENYVRSKFRITQNMTATDALIYCADDPVIMQYLKEYDIKAQMLPFSINNVINNNITAMYRKDTFKHQINEMLLTGKHNHCNAMAATLAGMVMNIKKSAIRESLRRFQSVEHRLERVMSVRGIEFINDSKATNVNSTWYALDSMTAPVIWIVGGTDKGNDYSALYDIVRQKVKAIVCLGKDNSKIKECFASIVPSITETQSAADAVNAAYYLGSKGDVALLSPACASFDLFRNYEDRGRQFKEAVRSL